METWPNSNSRKRGLAARRWRWAARCCAAGAFVQCLIGCGSPSTFQFDELDVSRAHLLNEVSLGSYRIPVPIKQDRSNDNAPRRNQYRFDFELHALVAPEHASNLTGNWQRHEGMIRDRVIRVCRNATVAELREPELATLKARLMDALQAQLGERDVRRLLLTEVTTQQL